MSLKLPINTQTENGKDAFRSLSQKRDIKVDGYFLNNSTIHLNSMGLVARANVFVTDCCATQPSQTRTKKLYHSNFDERVRFWKENIVEPSHGHHNIHASLL